MAEKRLFGTYTYATHARIMEVVAIFLYLTATIWISYLLAFEYNGAWTSLLWMVPTAMLVGAILADFGSGTVHWLADTFGTADMPVLGPNFVRPFREHHTDPKGITHHDFVEVNGNNCVVIMLFGMPFFLLIPNNGEMWAIWLEMVLLSKFAGIFATNQIHKWSHQDNPPPFAQFLQRTGLIMSVEHHNVHHTAPYDSYYCITTGWLNPMLEKIGFFTRLEKIVRAVWPWADKVSSTERDARTLPLQDASHG